MVETAILKEVVKLRAALEEERLQLGGAVSQILENLPAQIAEYFAIEGDRLIRRWMAYRPANLQQDVKLLSQSDLEKLVDKRISDVPEALSSYRDADFRTEPASSDGSDFRQAVYHALISGKIDFQDFPDNRVNPNVYHLEDNAATVDAIRIENIRSAIVANVESIRLNQHGGALPAPDPRYLIAYEIIHSDLLPIGRNSRSPNLHNMIVVPVLSLENGERIGSFRLMNCYTKTKPGLNYGGKSWFNSNTTGALKLFAESILSKLAVREQCRGAPGILNTEYRNVFEMTPYSQGEIVGCRRSLDELFSKIKLFGPTDEAVLITGESGTGKEPVARHLVQESTSEERKKKYIQVNCSAIPKEMMESEFFGHEKGAFTGANERYEGRFLSADKGTILLDEIGDMVLELQPKLLRVLQEGQFQLLRSEKTETVDVRVIAATNKNLPELIKDGKFGRDLYARLSVFKIHLQPLRERLEDIPELLIHFLTKFARKYHKSRLDVESRAFDVSFWRTQGYSWPLNIRGVQAVCARATVMMGEKNRLSLEELVSRMDIDESESEITTSNEGSKKLALPRQGTSESPSGLVGASAKISESIGFLELQKLKSLEVLLESTNGSLPLAAKVADRQYQNFYNFCDRWGKKLIVQIDSGVATSDEVQNEFPYFWTRTHKRFKR